MVGRKTPMVLPPEGAVKGCGGPRSVVAEPDGTRQSASLPMTLTGGKKRQIT